MRRTTTKLSKEEYVPFAPTTVGAEVHIHHCKQGKDNDRLYIKREYDGSIVAYCHHCGKSGRHDERRIRLHSLVSRVNRSDVGRGTGQGDGLSLPSDAETKVNQWPLAARQWVRQYGLTDEEIEHVGNLAYSSWWGRVLIPTYAKMGELLRWQGRAISGVTDKSPEYNQRRSTTGPKDHGPPPKYHNKNKEGAKKQDILQASIFHRHGLDASLNPQASGSPRVLVIVEDALSGIKVSRIHDALVLHGSSAKLKDLTFLKDYDIIYIYLDNDNTQVKTNQHKLKCSLELLGAKVIVVHSDCDPKEQSMQTLEELLNVHRNRTITRAEEEGRLPEVPKVHQGDSD